MTSSPTPMTPKVLIAEIIGPDGTVHYRRPEGDPMIEEAGRAPGYHVRMVTSDRGKIDLHKEPLTTQELSELDQQYFHTSTPEYLAICRMRSTVESLSARAETAERRLREVTEAVEKCANQLQRMCDEADLMPDEAAEALSAYHALSPPSDL